MSVKTYKAYAPVFDLRKAVELNFELMHDFLSNPEIEEIFTRANNPYLHWEDLRHKNWIIMSKLPNKDSFWTLLKWRRYLSSSSTPIRDSSNQVFKMNIKNHEEFLHIIDKEMAGNFMGITNFSQSDKKKFITRNLIEESIASSKLEGANTSRIVAKKMLLEGRKPTTHSEQMIVNNHQTMRQIEQELYKEELSLDLLCTLHSMITDKTLSPDKQGKLRETFNEKGVRLTVELPGGVTAYTTPDREFVEKELPRLIDFANDKKIDDGRFIHPLIKAIMLHFWIGLLHPFEDGNGRLARILFYWYMLKHEYWAFAYLSLSEKIKKSPKQYAMAYIYSEQDDCDLTYFIEYNIKKLKEASKDFHDYIENKIKENRSLNSITKKQYNFNERQIKTLHYFNLATEERTSLATYEKIYSVKKGTASSDLKELVTKGFFTKSKQGRNVYYYATDKIKTLFT